MGDYFTPLDHAWAAINALGGAEVSPYNRAIADALAELEKLGATSAAWDAGYPKGET